MAETTIKRVTIAKNSKYNSKIATRIVKAIAHGLNKEQASNLVGISIETLYHWLKIYPELSKKIESAKDKYTEIHLKGIAKAGERSWQARAWLLERTRPEVYSPKLNQTIDSNQPVVFNVDLQGTYKPTVATKTEPTASKDTKPS